MWSRAPVSSSSLKPRKAKLHNRFNLTDTGGIIFGIGLDDGDGAVGETDYIKLLDNETYKFCWAQYTANLAFDLVDELVIEGNRIWPSGKRLWFAAQFDKY